MMLLSDEAKRDAFTIEEECDLGFLCREVQELFDEMRKEVKARQVLFSRRIALVRARQAMQGDIDDTTVRGELSVGSPSIVPMPKIPRKDTDEYLDLCKWIGIPPDMAKSGAVKFSWTRLQEECAKRIAAGAELPPGISETYSEPTTVFRRRPTPKT